jgi:metallophosphoesterase superfamily enzyme
VAGHLHPALLLQGKAKQRLRLPGWWFQRENQALIMPNFGTFTGSSAVKMKEGDQFWIATEESVMPAN